jgi:hypothetical protein
VQVRNHIEQELRSTLATLWELPDDRLVAHVHALNVLGETRAALEDTGPREVLDILSGVASSVLDHGVATLERKLCSWEARQDDWELWRVDPCVINPRHPVSQALWVVHDGACTAMLQFAALCQVAQSSCKVTLEDVHERCGAPSCACCCVGRACSGACFYNCRAAHVRCTYCFRVVAVARHVLLHGKLVLVC